MAALLLGGAVLIVCAAVALALLVRPRPAVVPALRIAGPAPEPASRRLLLALIEEACIRQGWEIAGGTDDGGLEARLGRERLLVDVIDPGLDDEAAAQQVRRTARLRSRRRLRSAALIAFGAVSPETRRLGLKHRVEVVDGKELVAFLTASGRPRSA